MKTDRKTCAGGPSAGAACEQTRRGGAGYLVAGGRVDLCRQGLRFGLGGKQVLGFVEAEAQDLAVQVVVLIPQLVVLLWESQGRRQGQLREAPGTLSTHHLPPLPAGMGAGSLGWGQLLDT